MDKETCINHMSELTHIKWMPPTFQASNMHKNLIYITRIYSKSAVLKPQYTENKSLFT